MKRFLCAVFTTFAAVLVMGLSAAMPTANASVRLNLGDQDFTLVNKTGFEIYAEYVSPHRDNSWGEDIMGLDTLPNRRSACRRSKAN